MGFSGGRDYSCCLTENRILLPVFVNRSTSAQISHYWLTGEVMGTELRIKVEDSSENTEKVKGAVNVRS